MTLILTVNGPEMIWMLADRQISYAHRPPKDDGHKIMFLGRTDGDAILGYAGLGETVLGTEPADWMSAVLRGISLPLEQSLGALALAMYQQLPPHLSKIRGSCAPSHDLIATAFVDGEARLYSIGLAFPQGRKPDAFAFAYQRHYFPPGGTKPPPVTMAGSGATHLTRDKKWMKKWIRNLLRVVKTCDRGQVPPSTVADHLAGLNHAVHLRDEFVGPRCIVAWRPKKGGVHHMRNGGGQQYYIGTTPDATSPVLPTIGHDGMDLRAIHKVLLPHALKLAETMGAGGSASLDIELANKELACLPDKPDEKLR